MGIDVSTQKYPMVFYRNQNKYLISLVHRFPKWAVSEVHLVLLGVYDSKKENWGSTRL